MVTLSFGMMLGALILGGVNLWLRDSFTPNLPVAFVTSDVIWLFSFVAVFFFWRYPWLTLASAWVLLVAFVLLVGPFQPSHTLGAFLYTNIFPIVNLIFAHLGLYFKRRTKSITA
jgi:hypothetical protein